MSPVLVPSMGTSVDTEPRADPLAFAPAEMPRKRIREGDKLTHRASSQRAFPCASDVGSLHTQFSQT
jgi:hypothetical protein